MVPKDALACLEVVGPTLMELEVVVRNASQQQVRDRCHRLEPSAESATLALLQRKEAKPSPLLLHHSLQLVPEGPWHNGTGFAFAHLLCPFLGVLAVKQRAELMVEALARKALKAEGGLHLSEWEASHARGPQEDATERSALGVDSDGERGGGDDRSHVRPRLVGVGQVELLLAR